MPPSDLALGKAAHLLRHGNGTQGPLLDLCRAQSVACLGSGSNPVARVTVAYCPVG